MTETELARAEANDGKVPDGVAKGEIVTGVELPQEPTGTKDVHNNQVAITFNGSIDGDTGANK